MRFNPAWRLSTLNRRGKTGRNERIRTSDPFVPNEVRYQAALHSDVDRCRDVLLRLALQQLSRQL